MSKQDMNCALLYPYHTFGYEHGSQTHMIKAARCFARPALPHRSNHSDSARFARKARAKRLLPRVWAFAKCPRIRTCEHVRLCGRLAHFFIHIHGFGHRDGFSGKRALRCDDERPKRFILQWHITHRCNLSCVHCYQKDDACCASYDSLIEVLDKYERFLQANHYYAYIYLTGGEPLTHPDFFPLLKELRRRKHSFCVLSNGTLIDACAANQLSWYQTDFVQVSLDGTREIHDRIRGRGAFDRALRGIDELTAAGIPVVVSFTAQKGNRDCFAALAKICDQHGVRKLWWDRVVTDTPESTAALALTTEEFMTFVKEAWRLNRKYRRKDGSSLVSCERSLQFLGCRKPSSCYTCHAGQDMVTILADGSVMPCRRLPFVIGNIHNGELEDLINASERMAQLQDPPIPQECFLCAYAQTCRGGAKCVTYGQTGSLFEKDINCFIR